MRSERWGAKRRGARRSASRSSLLISHFCSSGDPGTIRTCDLPLRRGTLYPAELRGQSAHYRKDAPRVPTHSVSCGPIPPRSTPPNAPISPAGALPSATGVWDCGGVRDRGDVCRRGTPGRAQVRSYRSASQSATDVRGRGVPGKRCAPMQSDTLPLPRVGALQSATGIRVRRSVSNCGDVRDRGILGRAQVRSYRSGLQSASRRCLR